jgi:hypothetical protein
VAQILSGKTLDLLRNTCKIHHVTRQDAPLILPCDAVKTGVRLQGALFRFKIDVQTKKAALSDNSLRNAEKISCIAQKPRSK